jgi:hypothetical protein
MAGLARLPAAFALPVPAPAFASPAPSSDLAPEAVVRRQLPTLRDNDATDVGIAAIFAFASPTNQRQTGPLAHFTERLRAPAYDVLINHRAARYGPTVLSATRRQQVVTITIAEGGE